MGNNASSPKVTAQDKAILQLKIQKDKLVQYQRKMSLIIRSETAQTKLYLKQGDKHRAKLLLKKTKYQQKLLEDVGDQMFNLENMIHNIEFKLIEKDFFKGLQNGNDILSKLNNEMRVEDVERLVDDVNDNIAYQQEIEETLANVTVGQDLDDELDDELAALDREVNGTKVEQVPQMPTTEGLPEVKEPEVKLPQAEQAKKETRQALQA